MSKPMYHPARLLRLVRSAIRKIVRPIVLDVINHDARIWGDSTRVHVSKKARMHNTLFNTSSGSIFIEDYVFTGHNVAIITGTHDYTAELEERMNAVPSNGRDVHVGRGVWIGTNAVILGPCKIGEHAVIAAGSLVNKDVPPYAIVAGCPAKVIKVIRESVL